MGKDGGGRRLDDDRVPFLDANDDFDRFSSNADRTDQKKNGPLETHIESFSHLGIALARLKDNFSYFEALLVVSCMIVAIEYRQCYQIECFLHGSPLDWVEKTNARPMNIQISYQSKSYDFKVIKTQ